MIQFPIQSRLCASIRHGRRVPLIDPPVVLPAVILAAKVPILIVVPLVALLVDTARYVPGIVYLMMLSGAVIGLSFAVMILAPLYETWLKREAP